MARTATIIAPASAAVLIAVSSLVSPGTASAMTLARTVSSATTVIPAVNSNAHKGIGGNYGGLKSLRGPRRFDRGPSFNSVAPKSNARKQPYPYRYYDDTSRGNYGCHRYGKLAIETDNANWWARYRACTEVGTD